MVAANELLVLSNRGPFSYAREPDGSLRAVSGGGGLVAVLDPGVRARGALWLWAAASPEEQEAARHGTVVSDGRLSGAPVEVDPAEYGAYYDVISNQTVWFCLHGLWDLPRKPRFDRHWWKAWEAFCSVNERFAAAAAKEAAEGAVVLVHDYHLALVPALLTERRPDLRIASFVHVPWCSPEELSILPDSVVEKLLSGLGAAACGFHTRRWSSAFEDCCSRWLGTAPQTYETPAAPDFGALRSVVESPECQRAFDALDELAGGRSLIVRVERIEPSKNVLRGFWAFDELLESRPDLRGEVVFAAMLYPSRLGVADYLAYGQEVRTLAEHLNSKWGRAGWTPIVVDPDDDRGSSVAALRRADVLMVNPVRDGLNLVAKEGPLVNEREAVLLLSRQAGAWDELGEHAVGVNPFDVSETAAALATAIEMDPSERAERAKALREAILSHTALDWLDDQVAAAVH